MFERIMREAEFILTNDGYEMRTNENFLLCDLQNLKNKPESELIYTLVMTGVLNNIIKCVDC